MKDADIELMRAMEGKYWWHVSRRLILQSILNRYAVCQPSDYSASNGVIPRLRSGNKRSSLGDKLKETRQILDIGCGSGRNMQWLKNFGEVTGIDSSSKAIEFCQQYGKTILADAVKLPMPNGNFNLVTAFDVLEHIKDNEMALREWGRVLQSNGYLFISVPAYQWLFSNRDRKLGHYRRYSLYNLQQMLWQTGFEPVFSSYIFVLVFPLLILQRILLQKDTSSIYPKLPNWLNKFLIQLSNLEASLIKFIRLPFGGSIVILAKKSK